MGERRMPDQKRDPARRDAEVRRERGEDLPPAGSHADPALSNPDATPGTGTLPPPGDHDDVDSTSG